MPSDPPKNVVCEFRWLFGKTRRVTIDYENKTVCFENCHTPRKFLATAESTFTCPINEILEHHETESKNHRKTLLIVTSRGRAAVPSWATNYRQLRDLLPGICGLTPGGAAIEHPEMIQVCMFGALAGCAVGPLLAGLLLAFCAPKYTMPVELLALLMFLGAITGVVTGWVVVDAVDRRFGISLVLPLRFGATGLLLSLLLTGQFGPTRIAICLVVGLIGVVFGTYLEKRRQRTQGRRRTELT